MNFQHSMLMPKAEERLVQELLSTGQGREHVCVFQGTNCGYFRSITTSISRAVSHEHRVDAPSPDRGVLPGGGALMGIYHTLVHEFGKEAVEKALSSY